MAWEQRGSGIYYYRKKRKGNRVVSEYVGRGPYAVLEDLLVREEQRARKEERETLRRIQQEDLQTSQQLDRVENVLYTLADALIRACGYHKHKGQWRKQRHASTTHTPPGGGSHGIGRPGDRG